MQFQGTANNVEIIGWLGADPEQRFIPSGAAVTSFSVATKRPSHSGGEPKTEWIPVEAWERLAELIARHLHKGSRVRVVGLLTTRSWEDRETGQRRSRMVVRAENVLFLDARQPLDEDKAEEAMETLKDLPF
jgi:single-strand DNA-binding protein